MKKLQKQFSLDIHIELLLKIRVLNNMQRIISLSKSINLENHMVIKPYNVLQVTMQVFLEVWNEYKYPGIYFFYFFSNFESLDTLRL